MVQLDRYHIKRDVTRHFGYEVGKELYKVLQEGKVEAFLDTLESLEDEAKEKEKRKRRKRLVKHFKKYKEHLLDYRYRLPEKLKEEEKLYGMGVAEGYVDKNVARRMKNQGMSWSEDGAQAMVKILMLKHNQELKKRLEDKYYKIENPVRKLKYRRRKHNRSWSKWLRKSMPVFKGPASGKSWIKGLKELVTV